MLQTMAPGARWEMGAAPNGEDRGAEQSWNHWATLSDMSSGIRWVGESVVGESVVGVAGIGIQNKDAALASQVFLRCCE